MVTDRHSAIGAARQPPPGFRTATGSRWFSSNRCVQTTVSAVLFKNFKSLLTHATVFELPRDNAAVVRRPVLWCRHANTGVALGAV